MRLSGGPTGWIAGSRRTGRGPGIWSPRRGPPCSGPPCAAAGSRRCAPTLTRRPRSSQRQASRHQAPRWPRGSLASLPVTLTTVTDGCRRRSGSHRKPVDTSSRLRHWPNWRCWRWRGGTGARPRPWPTGPAPCCGRPGSTDSCPARCKPVSPCIGATTRRQQLVRAQRLRPASTYGQPHLAVQARIELIRVHLALADITGARTLMQETEEILGHRPDLGTLASHVKQLHARLGEEHGPKVPGASALTTAELHLLPLLCTHMTVPEIAADLVLSPHTIKSQLRSIYRKLDATSRHQAVTRARELGLIDR